MTAYAGIALLMFPLTKRPRDRARYNLRGARDCAAIIEICQRRGRSVCIHCLKRGNVNRHFPAFLTFADDSSGFQ